MFHDRFRFILCLISFFALASIYSNLIIINFTFICMTNDQNDTIVLEDGNIRQRYNYTTSEKSSILSSIGVGTLIATFPITHLISKVGARHPFYFFGLLSCAMTALIPLAARTNFWLLIAVRFIQGIAYASDFTTIGKICVEWAPLREISFFIGFLTVFSIWSSVITNPVSAWFCQDESMGWEWSFYAHALLGSAIIKNKTIIVCWISAFLDITSTLLLIQYAPTYFSKVLNFDVVTTGFLVSLVSFSQLPFKTIFCMTSDRMRCMSERRKMLFYNCFAFVICGIIYASFAFAPWREIVVLLFCLVSITSSANCGSFYKCANFVARQHAHFVISAIQFTKCLSLFAAPELVRLMVSNDEDKHGWNKIFIGFGAVLVLTHFVFWAVVTDEPAEFTKSRAELQKVEKMRNNSKIYCASIKL